MKIIFEYKSFPLIFIDPYWKMDFLCVLKKFLCLFSCKNCFFVEKLPLLVSCSFNFSTLTKLFLFTMSSSSFSFEIFCSHLSIYLVMAFHFIKVWICKLLLRIKKNIVKNVWLQTFEWEIFYGNM